MARERGDGSPSGMGHRLIAPVLTISLPFLLLSSAIRIEMNSLGLYIRGFRVYAVAQVTGLAENQLEQAAVRLIHYFNSLADSPQMLVSRVSGEPFSLFHDYELIHLADVKLLFAANSVVQAVSLLLVVFLVFAGLSLGRSEEVRKGLRLGSVATLVLLAATAFAFVTDFGRMFTLFHLAVFDNSFWLLDPRTDYLVMLFPFGFWQDMFLIAGASTGLSAAGLHVLATLPTRRAHRRLANKAHVNSETRDV